MPAINDWPPSQTRDGTGFEWLGADEAAPIVAGFAEDAGCEGAAVVGDISGHRSGSRVRGRGHRHHHPDHHSGPATQHAIDPRGIFPSPGASRRRASTSPPGVQIAAVLAVFSTRGLHSLERDTSHTAARSALTTHRGPQRSRIRPSPGAEGRKSVTTGRRRRTILSK